MSFFEKNEISDDMLLQKFEGRAVSVKLAFELLRSLSFYFIFLFISTVLQVAFVMMYESITEQFERVLRLMYVTSSLSIPFTLFSVMRSTVLYDKEAQLVVLSSLKLYSFKGALSCIYKSHTLRRKIITHSAVALLFILALPYDIGYTQLAGAFFPDFDVPPGTMNLVVKLIMCPLALLLIHAAFLSSIKWWYLGSDSSREKILTSRHTLLNIALSHLKTFLIYGVCFYVLPEILLLGISFLSVITIIKDFSFLIWIFAIFAFIIAFHYLCAISKRRKFIKRLLDLAKDEGWTISDIHRPYLSVLHAPRGASFRLEKDGKIYTCKLLSSVRRKNPTYIDFEGKITAKITFSIFKLEIFHWLIDTDYTFEGEGQKTVILAPAPKHVFINLGRTDIAPDSQDARFLGSKSGSIPTPPKLRKSTTRIFQTGDKIGDYKFFTEEGFISAMDNDCLER